MLTTALLLYLGKQMDAPTMFYIILGIKFIFDSIKFGIFFGKVASKN